MKNNECMHAYGNRTYSRLKILAMFYIIPTGVKFKFMHINHSKGSSIDYSYTIQHSKPLSFLRPLRKHFKPWSRICSKTIVKNIWLHLQHYRKKILNQLFVIIFYFVYLLLCLTSFLNQICLKSFDHLKK